MLPNIFDDREGKGCQEEEEETKNEELEENVSLVSNMSE